MLVAVNFTQPVIAIAIMRLEHGQIQVGIWVVVAIILEPTMRIAGLILIWAIFILLVTVLQYL
ncbi:MAG TPA: hypothetical protein DE061_02360 [Clostridiales bacterium]|nr:hypothetical protein [Clostridiales bacterium]